MALSLVGLFINVTQFLQSYLLAYMWCLGVTLGCLALGMVHQLSGGAWGVVIRRPIGAASRVMPVMTLLFLPIVFGMGHLYIWTHADVVAQDELLQHKQVYLNTTFFLVRAAVYFLVWNALSYVLNALSLEQDRTADPRIARRMQVVSGGGLLAYGITITFASFDWLMSIEPHWFSTMYGVLIIGGQGLGAMAFLISVLVWLSRRPPLDRIVVSSHFHDLGNLMLAFVMLWAYFSFSQYLIIWAGNLPHEISWYLHRTATSWRFVGHGARRVSLRRAVRASAVACDQAAGRVDHQGRRPDPDRAARGSVVARGAGLPSRGHQRQLARCAAAAVDGLDLAGLFHPAAPAAARFCRFTIRSSTRRSATSSSGAANPQRTAH